MAVQLWSDVSGTIIRFDTSERGDPPPAEYTYTLRFDEVTNAELVQALLDSGFEGYTLTDQLYLHGQPVTINPTDKRRARLLRLVLADLNALSAAQKTNIWNDFISGTPSKWQMDAGPRSTDVFTAALIGTHASGGLQQQMRLLAVAAYVLDNPAYLVNPAFDATINVPGDEEDL